MAFQFVPVSLQMITTDWLYVCVCVCAMRNEPLGSFSCCRCQIAQMYEQHFVSNRIIPTSFKFRIPLTGDRQACQYRTPIRLHNIGIMLNNLSVPVAVAPKTLILSVSIICNTRPACHFIKFSVAASSDRVWFVCVYMCQWAITGHDIIVIKF